MKKVVVSTLILCFLIGLAGCVQNSEESDESIFSKATEDTFIPVPENPRVLIGSSVLGSEGDGIGSLCEVKNSAPDIQEEDKKGTTKTFEILGAKIESNYSSTLIKKLSKNNSYHYIAGKVSIYIDSITNNITGFSLDYENYPEGYERKIKKVTEEEARVIAKKFIKDFSGINVDGYVEELKTGNLEISILYFEYINQIQTHFIMVNMDKEGNIISYGSHNHSDDVKVPDWNDQVYIDGAMNRINSYNEGKGVKEVKDSKVNKKRLVYLKDENTYAVEYQMSYTSVYEDGTEKNAGNAFYYILP